MGGGGTDHGNTFNWPPIPWEIGLPSMFKCRSIMFLPFFPWNTKKGAMWAPVFLLLWGSPVGMVVAVQEAFQSPRYYFTFNLVPPLYFLTFENRSRSCREETEIHLTWRGRLWKGEHNWAEGSGWQRFLIFKLSQESIPCKWGQLAIFLLF